jgi:DNA-binding transcriptional LysR family regulator
MYNWDDLRFFLELSRQGTLSRTASRLGVEHTTVARRIAALEGSLQAHLFDRSPKGYRITETGQKLLVHAEAMESESLHMMREIAGKDMALSGTVRLATPEGFGSQFLARHFHLFRELHPDIELELIAESRPLSLSKREADLAITLDRPDSGRLIAKKLADYQLRLYGSQEYLKTHPQVHTLADLADHDFIWYVDDLMQLEPLRHLLERKFKDPRVVFRSTSIAAQTNATQSGLGLALLHCFHADLLSDLVPILPSHANVVRELWMVVHEDLRHIARIDAVINFITDLVANNKSTLMGA